MLPVAQFVATLCCIVFAGAAIYVNLVEHPARMGCSTQIAATVWAPSYKRGTWMQAPLAIVSFLAGTASWLLGASIGWLVGAIIILAVVPFTFIAIMPTNNQLLAPGRDLTSPETRALLKHWASCMVCAAYLVCSPQPCSFGYWSGSNHVFNSDLNVPPPATPA